MAPPAIPTTAASHSLQGKNTPPAGGSLALLLAMFPVHGWFNRQQLFPLWIKFLLFALCAPFLLLQYFQHHNTELIKAAWVFSLYFAALWGVFLHQCIRPETLRILRVAGIWLFTSIIGVGGVLLLSLLAPKLPFLGSIMRSTNSPELVQRLFAFIVGVGLVEEFFKAIPLLFLIRRKTPIQPRTLAFLGVISGLAFGATEAVIYSLKYDEAREAMMMTSGDYLMIQLLRLINLPVLHALWTGTLGYFMGVASNTGAVHRNLLLLAGLWLMAILHGAYDTFSGNWYGIFLVAVTALLFVSYLRADGEIMRRLQPSLPSDSHAA